ncbi:ComF family protein [Marinospirillum perlucidum]|uniref:ComF family protein n=1 Tax=Marinospirillum perlucidum TaxID=1982602 RepID=UPI000DF4939C|nr:double zinc ribbon domain-containing protein [Marinospirillum perlucidum]
MLSTKIQATVNKLLAPGYRFNQRLRYLLPGECLLCACPVKTAEDLCPACRQELPYNADCCRQCSQPLDLISHSPLLCKNCQQQPPAFDQLLAPLKYEPPWDRLLLAFKTRGQRTAGGLLVDLLRQELENRLIRQDWDALVVLPAQKNHQHQRSLHAPTWLGRRLAWSWQLPFRPQLLQRRKNRSSQQGLDRKKRWKNPKGAFQASKDVEGLRLLLVDDVATTGASCHWAAQELKDRGALAVTAIAAARTPRF